MLRAHRLLPALLAVPLLIPLAAAAPAEAATSHPSVTSVSATSGPTIGKVRITVHGSHFTHVTAVAFGSAHGSSIDVSSSTKLTVIAPAHAAGRIDVRVTTRSGTSASSSHDHFTYQLYSGVSVGYAHSCSVTSSEQVLCWGSDASGQIGDGVNHPYALTPALAKKLSHVVAVSAGDGQTCALRTSGSVYCWGANNAGQVGGTPSATKVSTPTKVSGVTHAVAISAGTTHTCAAMDDGTVRCWGDNQFGELGTGSTSPANGKVEKVKHLDHVIQIDAGSYFTCALLSTGKVYCWGHSAYGALGDGDETNDRYTPTEVYISHVSSISAGQNGVCATTRGTAKCWGANDDYELGEGSSSLYSAYPVSVVALTGVSAVAYGARDACAVAHGAEFCWGYGGDGSIGDGATPSYQPTPAAVLSPASVTQVAMYNLNACQIRTNHHVYCWGYNVDGQVGNGTQNPVTTPTRVPGT